MSQSSFHKSFIIEEKYRNLLIKNENLHKSIECDRHANYTFAEKTLRL